MKMTLLSKEVVIKGVVSFSFQPQKPVDFQPGQYMHYSLPHPNADNRGLERWFTISAAPYEQKIMITTRFDGQRISSFKQALQKLEVGDQIEADGPKGKFLLKEGSVHHILVAGGIGITPYRAMLAQLAHDGRAANAHLLYANRDDNLVFGPELENIAQKDPTFKITKFIDKKLAEADYKPYVNDPKTVFYLSGPHGMVESYESLLKNLGLSEDRIMTDYFPGY